MQIQRYAQGHLSGWPLFDEKCSEASVIQEIVDYVSKELLDSTYLDVADYLVGTELRVQEIEKLLDLNVRDVRMVGIWGAGGIGKTTIAKAVYNSISDKFEGSCILENVSENSSREGLVKLQQILLREILKEQKLKVSSVAGGIPMIKDRLQYKTVLLVLDDVNDTSQLNDLARQRSWFGIGSRIIITTRDMKLLKCHGVRPDLIYQVQKMALELFSVKAFQRSRPLNGYAEFTESAVRYAQGLPLALTVLGSSLLGGNVEQWAAALDGSVKLFISVLQRLINLTSINLCGSESLTEVPDLSGTPNLQSLNLLRCSNLELVHSSVGRLDKLCRLYLVRCSRLVTVPPEVSWKSMMYLEVSNCRMLEDFITIVHEMESIEMLDLSGSGIKELHSWIGCCTSLQMCHTVFTEGCNLYKN